MKRYLPIILFLVLIVLTFPSCRDDDTTGNTLNGAWNGSISDSIGGMGVFALTIIDFDGVFFSGDWLADFPGAMNDTSGTLNGNISPTQTFLNIHILFDINIPPPPPICIINGSGTRTVNGMVLNENRFCEPSGFPPVSIGTINVSR